jgi:hypothetical protein
MDYGDRWRRDTNHGIQKQNDRKYYITSNNITEC